MDRRRGRAHRPPRASVRSLVPARCGGGICDAVVRRGSRGVGHGHATKRATSAALGPGAVVASGLAKENFLPLALCATVFVALKWRTFPTRGGRWLLAALAVVALGDCAILGRQLLRFGSQYGEERSPGTILGWATYVAENTAAFQALGVAALLLVLPAGRRQVRLDRAILVALTGLAVVQVAFYAGADHAGRYLLPTTLCAVGVWLVALRPPAELDSTLSRTIRIAAGCALAVALLLGTALSFRIAQGNADATRRFQARLDVVEATIRGQQIETVVLEPDDPYLDAELVYSLARYLRTDTSVTVMTTPAGPGTRDRDRSIAASLAGISARGTTDDLIAPLAPPPDCLSLTFGDRSPTCSRAEAAPR